MKKTKKPNCLLSVISEKLNVKCGKSISNYQLNKLLLSFLITQQIPHEQYKYLLTHNLWNSILCDDKQVHSNYNCAWRISFCGGKTSGDEIISWLTYFCLYFVLVNERLETEYNSQSNNMQNESVAYQSPLYKRH